MTRTDRAADTPGDSTILTTIERWARDTPDAVAITGDGYQLSYDEMNRRANQLAHHLRERGVGPETIVAVCLQRGWRLIVALLAILKAGGAYLPLDPEFPAARHTFMLSDARVSTVVTDAELRGRFDGTGCEVVDVISGAEEIARAGTANPPVSALSDNLAYVIYTSGSTGSPKGVQVEHGGLRDFLTSLDELCPSSAGHGCALFSSVAYDMPVPSIFIPLIRGKDIYLVEGTGVTAVESLAVAMSAGIRIDMLKITPTHLEILVAALHKAGGRLDVGCVVVAGEPFRSTHLDMLREVTSARCRIFNEYGPTETTVGATLYPVDDGSAVGGSRLPIGRAFPHGEVLVADEAENLVGAGMVGELWIAGTGLARGYLNRPELTAEKFRPHPSPTHAGQRVYCTGDLGRARPDANIEFLGRLDDQVKIRGNRVELGEIAAALTALDYIQSAVVVLYD